MIYLERQNILFLKPFKVAGTSFEIALSGFATPEDIVTLLHADEPLRTERGYQGPVNIKWSLMELLSMKRNDILDMLNDNQKRQKFVQHTNAALARERLDHDKFIRAFKVSIIRNPFDYLISHYFWDKKTGATSQDSLETWLQEKPWVLTRNEQFYFIGRSEIIDFYVRFEHIIEDEDIAHLEQRKPELSGLGDAFRITNAKSGIRPKDRSIDEYFAQKNELIDTVLFFQGHHIQRFGYSIPPRR